MGKPLSDEHKAKMAAGREKARQAKLQKEVPSAPPLNPPVETPQDNMADLVLKLMREVEDLKRANPNVAVTPEAAVETLAQMNGQTPSIGSQGVQGRVFKYPVEKSFYPDPTERLYNDERLKRFAMKENFYFKWDVEGETYEKYGITYTEPRFVVELWRYLLDDDGNQTGQMALINRQFQHEDEFIARVVADKMGLSFDSHEELLNEMRYQRIRTWLLGVFSPQKVNAYQRKSRTMVIDGKVVEVTDTEEVVEQAKGLEQAETVKYQTQVPRGQ